MIGIVFGMVASCQRQYVLSLECCYSHLGAHRWYCNLVSVLSSCNINFWIVLLLRVGAVTRAVAPPPGVFPYVGGMCGPKGYGFSAVLVINRVSILTDFGHKLGMVYVL